ncbi:hypothetical protein HBI25_016090 [Parastagonospora nodorum]|nr:hypothetical protein HBH53_019720 [Parastagonospora nodorum]KAH3977504.1 hypothetical protein HBH52_114130 [Parastagonospora nodorum]KAH3999868.1 hypothetical protein HBI10_107640 [Parastagonospora nodorum]KAH4022356.1 hypothetical protein HBI13_101560 [Parastagonospora nodorum]KAH4027635.1 hypothetical protein HBI09_141270 [Parastagonospora nodorum]
MASQNFDTPIPCCNVSPASVPADDKSSWCQANVNTCTEACGGQGQIATNGNSCDPTSLDYSCKCSNGTDITSALAAYSFTVPGQMCQFWFGQCISAANGNSQQQSECNGARNANCGTRIIGSGAQSSLRSAAASATSAQASASKRVSATAARQSSDPRLPASSSSSSSWSSLTDLPTIAPNNRNRPSKNSGSSIGAITGAVVGGLLGLILVLTLIWLFLRRRNARKSAAPTAGDTGSSYDEKEVSDPVNMILPLKAELPGNGSSGTHRNAAWQHTSHHEMVSELDASTNAELYASSPHQTHYRSANLQGGDRPYEAAELRSSTPQPGVEPSASLNVPMSSGQIHQRQSSNDQHTQSVTPERSAVQRQLSAEEITALEEEEERIDAELEEVKRMKELRDQKIAIQQKLRDAKGVS